MSVFTPTMYAQEQLKVKANDSQYIKTENESDEAVTKPTEPAVPERPKSE